MDNVDVVIEEDTLHLHIDLTEDLGYTKTGKSRVVANSKGWQRLSGGSLGDRYKDFSFQLLVVKRPQKGG